MGGHYRRQNVQPVLLVLFLLLRRNGHVSAFYIVIRPGSADPDQIIRIQTSLLCRGLTRGNHNVPFETATNLLVIIGHNRLCS